MTTQAPALPRPTMSATVDRGLVTITVDTRPREPELDFEADRPRTRRRRRERIVCGACGTPGHSRSNRRCPAWYAA